jgi:glycosyltransferase involved in cell wall biosynthesis
MNASQIGLAAKTEQMKPPLVSIIITNFNYRDYVAAAISSALSQSYANVELIVVDDVSTDDSVAIIRDCLREAPHSYLIRRVYNGGQGAAFLDGLRKAKGEFVCFLDADDILLPDFCAQHVYLHLALPQQVAFTASDLVHITKEGRVSTGSSGNIRNTFLNPPAPDTALPCLHVSEAIDAQLAPHRPSARVIHLPAKNVGYFWSSCSGLMFKRAALELIAFEYGLAPTRLSADFYVTFSHLICGSAVLDAKLGGYRIHGKNGYSGETHLDGIDTSRRTPSAAYQDILRRFTHLVVTKEFEHFWGLLGKGWRYHELLASLQIYTTQFDRDRLHPRFVQDEILCTWDTFAARVGLDHARWIIRDVLGCPADELRTRGIL